VGVGVGVGVGASNMARWSVKSCSRIESATLLAAQSAAVLQAPTPAAARL